MSWISAIDAAKYLTAGAVLGAVYFVLLLRTVRLQAARAAAKLVAPLYLVRLALAVAVFWMIAQQGALPILLALLGFLITRFAALNWVGSE